MSPITIRLVDADTARTIGSAAVSASVLEAHSSDAEAALLGDDPELAAYSLVAVYHDHDRGYVAELIRE